MVYNIIVWGKLNFEWIHIGTRMTTSISSEAVWNPKKNVWNTESCKKEIKYLLNNKRLYIFTFLPFVAWLTDQLNYEINALSSLTNRPTAKLSLE